MPKKPITQKLVYPKTLQKSISPIEKTAHLVGDKWSILLLLNLMWDQETKNPITKPRRFSELIKLLPGISPKTLSKKLKSMEKLGVVKKTIYPEVPVRVEYQLTEKGIDLKEVLKSMASWSIKWHNSILHEPKP